MPDQIPTTDWTVVSLGGRQHLVKPSSRLVINRLQNKAGEELTLTGIFDSVPVKVRVITHSLGDKVSGLKFKNKTRYLKRYGHRQAQTVVEVLSIGQGRNRPQADDKIVKTTTAKPVTKTASSKVKAVKKASSEDKTK